MKIETVRVGLPVYESVPALSLASFLSISEVGSWTIVRGTWIDKARNDIMNEFEEDALLMLDADMQFGFGHVKMLLEALQTHPQCGAISGHYVTRNGTGLPACDWKHPEQEGWLHDGERRSRAQKHTREKSLIYVDSMGGGFLAITQEAKQKVGHPWFKTLYQDSGDYLGEDTFFCQRLREEGFQPAVHFGIQVGHVGQTIYRQELGE